MSTNPSPSSDVTVTVHRKPACRIELEVKASPTLVAAARKDAIKKVGKEVSFPGFRKGHVPEEMILKKHPAIIEHEWHKCIADAAFALAQLQAGVPILNTNAPVTFDLKKHSLEEGAELSFTFDTDPEVPTVDAKLFQSPTEEKRQVTDQEIDEAIHQMRFFYAKWKPIMDRGVQDGDYIMIDLETLDPTPETVFHQTRFEVSSKRMAEWMKRVVIGAKAGAVLECISEPDATATEEEKREFSPKKVRITVHTLEEAELPELEEFAKKMGANDIPSLRDLVRATLQKNLDDKAESDLRDKVNDFLIGQYTFEVPLTLIETERNHRKNQMMSDLKFHASYDKLPADEKKKVDEKIFMESDQAVRLFYLSRQIVRDQKITVTHEEVQEEAVAIAQSGQKKVDPAHLPKEIFALALSKIMLIKSQNYILANCKQPESAPALKT